MPPLEENPFGVCRISSPWLDLVVERKPVPSVRGIVRLSERQLLADQAVLAGARDVPPDLLWVFCHADHSHLLSFPYGASGSAGEAMRIRRDQYAQIVNALIDRCFESDGVDINYNSILDIDDPALLEQYKIIAPNR